MTNLIAGAVFIFVLGAVFGFVGAVVLLDYAQKEKRGGRSVEEQAKKIQQVLRRDNMARTGNSDRAGY